ncbi:MAG: AbrB/MazE/SpoVT family DNA-binding domain-containing protein [Clostridia bacterium]|nr:AbrB/MazE/SpoVT family DNA-binding domain-containing protein [Clostridia bacterium]
MRATGIIRRIDELGRVVIPKEIRRTMRLKEGEQLEIFSDNEELILKKYSEVKTLTDFSRDYAEAIVTSIGNAVIVTDTDGVIAALGSGVKEYHDKHLASSIDKVLADRKTAIFSGEDCIPVIEGVNPSWQSQIIAPIIVAGDIYGSLIMLADAKMGELELKIMSTASLFIGKQIER